MPICHDCHNYIDGPVLNREYGGLICPVCRAVIVDDPSALLEWMESLLEWMESLLEWMKSLLEWMESQDEEI